MRIPQVSGRGVRRPHNVVRPMIESLEGRSLLSAVGGEAIHAAAAHTKEIDPKISLTLDASQNGKVFASPLTTVARRGAPGRFNLDVTVKSNVALKNVVLNLQIRSAPTKFNLANGGVVQYLGGPGGGAQLFFNGRGPIFLPDGSIVKVGNNEFVVGNVAPGRENLPRGSSVTLEPVWSAPLQTMRLNPNNILNNGASVTFGRAVEFIQPGKIQYRVVLNGLAETDPKEDANSPKDEPGNADSDDTPVKNVLGDPFDVIVTKK